LENNEYIESGNVELGVIGALEPDEQTEFEQMRHQKPGVAAESLRTEVLYEDLSQSFRVDPLPWLKNRILRGLGRMFFF
jgi:hypothetical protein